MHPVLNLASARLIASTPANPEAVSASAIHNAKRGPLVGIPGAPATIAAPLGEDESGWTVCDDATSTTVIAGDVLRDGLATGRSVLVTPHSESAATTYLLFDGRRAQGRSAQPRRRPRAEAGRCYPRPVSRALLDATPEQPPIAAPHIPAIGTPSPLHGFPVGTVIRIARVAAEEYYVVLARGVQRIGQVAADLIRFTDSQDTRDIVTVAPDVIGTVPILDTLRVSAFPERGGVSNDAIVCARWWRGRTGVNTAVLMGNSLPFDGASPVTLAQADRDGPSVDSVAIPPGRSAFVRASGITGDGARIRRSLFRRRFGCHLRSARRGHRQAPRSHRGARAGALAGALATAARPGAEQGRRVSRA